MYLPKLPQCPARVNNFHDGEIQRIHHHDDSIFLAIAHDVTVTANTDGCGAVRDEKASSGIRRRVFFMKEDRIC